MIPMLLRVRIHTRKGERLRLWLPLFLVWLLVLLFSPLLLLVLVVGALVARLRPWAMLKSCWEIVNSLRGLDVDVQSDEADVLVQVL
jgi:hypothetical protein